MLYCWRTIIELYSLSDAVFVQLLEPESHRQSCIIGSTLNKLLQWGTLRTNVSNSIQYISSIFLFPPLLLSFSATLLPHPFHHHLFPPFLAIQSLPSLDSNDTNGFMQIIIPSICEWNNPNEKIKLAMLKNEFLHQSHTHTLPQQQLLAFIGCADGFACSFCAR